MKYDIVLAGVGGQGVLSLAVIISRSAMKAGLHVRQSEVHGMSQRGGAVIAHLRISDATIYSDLIPLNTADMVLSMEPLEGLRYINYLSENGQLVTSSDPFDNIPDYPDIEKLHHDIREFGRSKLVAAEQLARDAGTLKAINTVMVGAAAQFLPFEPAFIEQTIAEVFQAKGPEIVETNNKAFQNGQKA